MIKKWKVRAVVTMLYYIGVYRPQKRTVYVRAFTEAGARRKVLRKLKKRYKPKEIEIVRIRQVKQGD